MICLKRLFLNCLCFLPLLLVACTESSSPTNPDPNPGQQPVATIMISGGFTQKAEIGSILAVITNAQTVDIIKSEMQYKALDNTYHGKITIPNFDSAKHYSVYISVISKDSLVMGKSTSKAVLDTNPQSIPNFYPRNLRPNIEINANFSSGNVLSAGQKYGVEGLVQSKNPITSFMYRVFAVDTFIPNESLEKIKVTSTIPNSNSVYWDLSADSNTFLLVDSLACEGKYELQISATAGADQSTLYIPFTIINGVGCKESADFTYFTNGSLYNRMGPELGAFDLIAGVNVRTANSEVADLQDASIVGQGQSGEIESGNGSVFVRMNSLDYSTVSLLKVISIFQSETPTARITSVKVSDIICVKLRTQNLYTVLKITGIDPNFGSSTGNNKGVIRFDWKLQKN